MAVPCGPHARYKPAMMNMVQIECDCLKILNLNNGVDILSVPFATKALMAKNLKKT